MKEKLVPSAWLEQQGRRLDCGPYLSGAIEARLLLTGLPVRCAELRDLTSGHDGGIYNGPKFARNYVSDPSHGVPFLSSSGMLYAEFCQVGLLRKSDAVSARLAYLRLEEGMTLISCSGTIGRMAYTRPEMAGMWSSQHVLKIAPNPDKVRPGYLYAFLRGRFGFPLVVGGTYGAIVQHIEPRHIADLPVPLAPDAIQDDAHRLVTEAAEMRTRASAELRAGDSGDRGGCRLAASRCEIRQRAPRHIVGEGERAWWPDGRIVPQQLPPVGASSLAGAAGETGELPLVSW